MPKYDVVFIVSELVSGENMVRKRRFHDWLRHVLSCLRRFLCVIQAFARLICGVNAVRKRQSIVRKRRNGDAEMVVGICDFC